MGKLWQKYKCEKRASNIALSYGAKDIEVFRKKTKKSRFFDSQSQQKIVAFQSN